MEKFLFFNLYSFPTVLVMVIWYITHGKKIRTTQDRIFQRVLLLNALTMVSDLFTHFSENLQIPGIRILLYVLNIIYFIFNSLICVTWLNYLLCIFYHETLFTRNPAQTIPVFSVFCLNLVLILSTPFTGWLFVITSEGYYERGPLFFFPYLYVLFVTGYCILVLVHQLGERSMPGNRKENRNLLLFTLFPLIGTILQACFYGVWLALPMTTLGYLMVYIQIQNHQITLDALTGLNNRDYFDRYLQLQMKSSESWYLFILDMNHFKYINDTYGHTTGDRALREIAGILKSGIHQPHSFLARYGGDEFAVICVFEEDKEAQAFVCDLKAQTQAYNLAHQNPYTLSFSAGFAKYDVAVYDSAEKLIADADHQMYLDKGGQRR